MVSPCYSSTSSSHFDSNCLRKSKTSSARECLYVVEVCPTVGYFYIWNRDRRFKFSFFNTNKSLGKMYDDV